MIQSENKGIISLFVRHRVAPNLFMIIMVISGLWGLAQLRTQFFPTFELGYVVVSTVWTGAGAEDVEEGITTPLEQELRTVNGLKNITSVSGDGYSSVLLEFSESIDTSEAKEEVQEIIDTVTDLPSTSESPEVRKIAFYDVISDMVLTGDVSRDELVPLARKIESDLLSRGIAKVDIYGLPDEEVSIELSSAKLRELEINLSQVAQRISGQSQDTPAGKVGGGDVVKQLRSLDQSRTTVEFEKIPLLADKTGKYTFLGDVAEINRKAKDGQRLSHYKGKPAILFSLKRSSTSDSLEGAEILKAWLKDFQPELPDGIEVKIYNKRWEFIEQRISLLVENGIQGIILIALILYMFLNGRVSIWVMAGVPVSFLAALAALYFVGGTINMLSLFGLIMALGIIVDDAIVVSEDSLTHFSSGESPLAAAEGGAKRMFLPVMASSLTTIAAFFPLMLISGHVGKILFDIPLVVMCVIVASLIECFLVLPGHLKHSFEKTVRAEPSRARAYLDNKFNSFRDNYFNPLVTKAIEFRGTTLTAAFALLVLVMSYWGVGYISFTFFPSPEGKMVVADVSFISGTPEKQVKSYLYKLENAVYETDKDFGGGLVTMATTLHGSTSPKRDGSGGTGDNYGYVSVELVDPDDRYFTNSDFINAWKKKVNDVPGLEKLTMESPRNGPPSKDIDISIKGQSLNNLKLAANDIQDFLKQFDGVSAITDNLPTGHQQIIFKLNAQGQALGLSPQEIGRQLRVAYDGYRVQVFQDRTEKVEVWVRLAEEERESIGALENFTIRLPNGGSVSLSEVVDFREESGYESVNHRAGVRVVSVTADVDSSLANSNLILNDIKTKVNPEIKKKYGVEIAFEGVSRDQSQMFSEMVMALGISIAVIYIILAWIFNSYSWPIVVMLAIPFGLIGAVFGHIVVGIDVTILSLFGMFGLTGIVVNDSIILVVFFKELKEKGMPVDEALATASTQRLRAVILTSLTTIGGLVFLILETSLQAQFLIPMAVSMAFGLAFSTFLVLLVIPAGLSLQESITSWFKKIYFE